MSTNKEDQAEAPKVGACVCEELRRICAQSYQVVGILADEAGRFDDDAVIKALDNLSEQRLLHEDVLPFPPKTQVPT